ncbi:MAG: hypothetical protein HYZ28_20715 [Myxococcales bacterium]|nr:hypothetical protein [Myxococcales bacterium]
MAPSGRRSPARRKQRGTLAAARSLGRALGGLGSGGLRYLERAIVETSRRRELTYTRGSGRTVVIRLLPAPALLSGDDFAYLHWLCLTLTAAFQRTASAWLGDPRVREALPVEPGEEEWLRLSPPARAPLLARWDMNIDLALGARGATLFEVNGCAVGGLYYAGAASQALSEWIWPLCPGGLAVSHTLEELWSGALRRHARKLGAASPRIAWLEDRTWTTGITEGPTLIRRLSGSGASGMVADPREVDLRRGQLYCRGKPVDVLYRGLELRDLLAIEKRDGPLESIRQAVRLGRVVSPPIGDLDHKSHFEVWTTPGLSAHFSKEQRAAFRRHVPWTRRLTARHTEGPDGRRVDLPELARRNREQLVIKPDRSCGGEGVLLGSETRAPEWERAIAGSLSGRAPAVVQERIHSASLRVPTATGRRVADQSFFTTFGVLATDEGVGVLGRAAPFPVVNVARGGGLIGVLIPDGPRSQAPYSTEHVARP